MHEQIPPLATLAYGPLHVRWTGEPVWALTHFLQSSGRRGGFMPCVGDGCVIHTNPPKWRVYIPAIRTAQPRKRSGPELDRSEMERQTRQTFHGLPNDVQLRALQEANARNPQLNSQHLLEVAAMAILFPETAKAASPTPTVEAVLVDLPDGAALQVIRKLQDQPWRGYRCLLVRPHTAGDTEVKVLDHKPAELPEAFSVLEWLCRHWGYNADRVTVETNKYRRTVLRFPAMAEV